MVRSGPSMALRSRGRPGPLPPTSSRAARCDKVVVAGLSMGGTLTVWLAAHHPEIAGIVLVNALVDPPDPSFKEILQGMLDAGPIMPGIGSDIADPDVKEAAYDGAPI